MVLCADGVGSAAAAKKCRARYGLEHQSRWCKPCRSVTRRWWSRLVSFGKLTTIELTRRQSSELVGASHSPPERVYSSDQAPTILRVAKHFLL